MKKRMGFLFAAVALMVMMLSACGSTSNNSSSATTSSSKKSDTTTQTAKTGNTQKVAAKSASTGKVVTIKVMAKDFEYDKKVIHVKKGDKVRITLQSNDGGHGFALPAFNVNIQGNKSAEFTANKTGTFEYHCSVVCGAGHSKMTGKLIVD
ncbi:cytochrome C oxidase subunit II [Bacillus salipaludis]|uniref:Cupredoxin domain-containing protein n=1 Tax=Bacillus salipaludis TaxID=2547811 RepID=A0A4R5VP17_9BACI|nr:cupredoxin domain-containing protein [Bacillus salipaludis]MDQ6595822.1 cupredoxin domain-containing protein [Bacillus salipaludis]TDK59843.1 cytochrome C oxidase subunit II [Bacillus salipaludis]